MRRPLLLMALSTLLATSWSAEPARPPTEPDGLPAGPLRWTGVEVVTDDFESVEQVRAATGLTAGELMPLDSPRLKEACDAVRRAFPAATIRCGPTFGNRVDGHVQALYVVEVDTPPSRPLRHCTADIGLASDLGALLDEWKDTLTKTLFDGAADHERVNDEFHLDYDAPAMHRLAQRMHAAVKPRAAELERLTRSCAPDDRANAITLMNFTGTPLVSIRVATRYMLDPDGAVRNDATRLLAVFAKFIPHAGIERVRTNACILLHGNFTDRNKAMQLLDHLRQHAGLRLADLDRGCRDHIRQLARTSISGQIGEPAVRLVESSNSP